LSQGSTFVVVLTVITIQSGRTGHSFAIIFSACFSSCWWAAPCRLAWAKTEWFNAPPCVIWHSLRWAGRRSRRALRDDPFGLAVLPAWPNPLVLRRVL